MWCITFWICIARTRQCHNWCLEVIKMLWC